MTIQQTGTICGIKGKLSFPDYEVKLDQGEEKIVVKANLIQPLPLQSLRIDTRVRVERKETGEVIAAKLIVYRLSPRPESPTEIINRVLITRDKNGREIKLVIPSSLRIGERTGIAYEPREPLKQMPELAVPEGPAITTEPSEMEERPEGEIPGTIQTGPSDTQPNGSNKKPAPGAMEKSTELPSLSSLPVTVPAKQRREVGIVQVVRGKGNIVKYEVKVESGQVLEVSESLFKPAPEGRLPVGKHVQVTLKGETLVKAVVISRQAGLPFVVKDSFAFIRCEGEIEEAYVNFKDIHCAVKDLADSKPVTFELSDKKKDGQRSPAKNLILLENETDPELIAQCAQSHNEWLWRPVFSKYLQLVPVEEAVSLTIDKLVRYQKNFEQQEFINSLPAELLLSPQAQPVRDYLPARRHLALCLCALKESDSGEIAFRWKKEIIKTIKSAAPGSQQELWQQVPVSLYEDDREFCRALPIEVHIACVTNFTVATTQVQKRTVLLQELGERLAGSVEPEVWKLVPDPIVLEDSILPLAPRSHQLRLLKQALDAGPSEQPGRNGIDRLQTVLSQHLDEPILSHFFKEIAREILRQHPWEHFERQLLARLSSPLAEFARGAALALLDDSQLREAWNYPANRPEIRRLAPEQAKTWTCDGAVDEVLSQLKVAALDIEVRQDELKEIGLCSYQGPAKCWKSNFEEAFAYLADDNQIGVLVGHNLAFDLGYLARASGNRLLAQRPVVDTLLLASILKPRSRQSLRLDGSHTALEDAWDTVQLLRRQIVGLAQLPEEDLADWEQWAGPGLRQLLAQVRRHRQVLSEGAGVTQPAEAETQKTVPVEKIYQQLRSLPDGQRVLVLLPRQLLPLVAELEQTVILDPGQIYLEEPDRERLAALPAPGGPEIVPIDDFLVCVSAFVRQARRHGQCTHPTCMATWVYGQLESQEGLLTSIGASYDKIRAALQEVGAARCVVPFDALQPETEDFWRFLQQQPFEQVWLIAPEAAPGQLMPVSLKAAGDSWQAWQVLAQDNGLIGLSEAELAAEGISLPPGWGGWLASSPLDGLQVQAAPRDLTRYIQSRFPGLKLKVIPWNREARRIDVADLAAMGKSGIDQTGAWLEVSTRYQGDYLGQVAGLVAPLAEKQRVLLLVRRRDQTDALSKALSERVYVPVGTRLTRMERISRAGAGLAIDDESDLLAWVLTAWSNNVPVPFDRVVLAAWPDRPELMPPLTLEDRKRARRALAVTDETGSDDEGQLPDEADDPEQMDDAVDTAEEEYLSAPGQRLAISEVFKQQLQAHGANALASFVWAADHLAGQPLLILDARLPLPEELPLAPYTLYPRKLEFDLGLARTAAQNSGLPGRLTPQDLIGADPADWNRLARQLFKLPGDLHDWQRPYLERILSDTNPPVTMTIEAPTGGGKSLLFQLPALLRGTQTGLLTLVISPLRALIHEQCEKLWNLGFIFSVDALSSDLSQAEVREIYHRLADGQIKLLFAAPERFRSKSFRLALQERLERDERLQYWVFDEAHCISLWGHDFRPDYFYAARQVQRMRVNNGARPAPVLLLSATLPAQVITELEEIFPNGH